ncbi:phage tail tube protein [Gallibacterium anatis]|uniref:Phage tail protein n=1 Tax=Avibacterium paragallinarum TaxID=728 RepID=A0A8B3T9V8_AVIPA|nr:phage tail tube protein [Avibacterium paragallinarum]RZN61359.1 phage tail protein [Avibacterium paragallinarum]
MKYHGIARIRVNGAEYPTGEDATLDVGGFTRETVKGARVYGYKETPTEATVECKMFNNAQLDVLEIKSWTNATVEFETDVGQTYLLANAWVVDAVTLTSKGEISVKFAAVECRRA